MNDTELNQAVAEVRGEGCMHYTTVGDLNHCDKNSIAFPDACQREGEEYCLSYTNKPYSTDISYAMELLQEIIPYHYRLEVQESHTRDGVSATIICCTSIICQVKGMKVDEVIARAIAECYLKWRKGA